MRNQTSGLLETVAGYADVDLLLSAESRNPVQNKTIYNALALKVEKTANDLINYYTKTDVYNKSEVRQLIGAINTLTIEVVEQLPTQDISTTTIYFVEGATAGSYDEYIYVNNTWVQIGDTQIDLSDYVTSTQLSTALQDYYSKLAVDALLDSYYTKTQVDTELNTKQDTLTFDETPTAGSNNPVKSGGVKTAIDTKQDALTFDNVPTASSNNPVKSGGIYTAINAKQGTLKTVSVNGSTDSNGMCNLGVGSANSTLCVGFIPSGSSPDCVYTVTVSKPNNVLDRA
jgi:hypothetical protein